MEKSAAYLMGFQAGFGEELSLEKAAGLIELLDFVPENEKQAMSYVQLFAKRFVPFLQKLLNRSKQPGKLPAAKSLVPDSLGVAFRGEGVKTVGTGIPAKVRKQLGQGSFGVERKAKM